MHGSAYWESHPRLFCCFCQGFKFLKRRIKTKFVAASDFWQCSEPESAIHIHHPHSRLQLEPIISPGQVPN